MDRRAYNAGYAWAKDEPESQVRLWMFNDEQIELPAGAVREHKHSGYHCLLAPWADVTKAAQNG